MRLPDSLSDTARRLLLTPVALFGFASIIATGGGSSEGGDDETDPDEPSAAITVSEHSVSAARGRTVRLRVDIEGLPEGRGASGYNIDLSESASGIDIQTSACPSGVGTVSCRDWSITPGAGTMPGLYLMEITAAGTLERIRRTSIEINVIGDLPPTQPALIAAKRLVVTNDGRLWVTGVNRQGQAGIGFWNGCDEMTPFTGPQHCLMPREVHGYTLASNFSDWVYATTSEDTSLAVRSDGTVWAWGSNSDNLLGFVGSGSTGVVQISPQQVPDVAGIQRVSIGKSFHVRDDSFLALTNSGQVLAWGGDRHASFINGVETAARSARVIPQAVTTDGVETPFDDVVDIAGGTNQAGFGFALALRGDGTVWQWGDSKFYLRHVTPAPFAGFEFRASEGMPARVQNLPEPVRAIAVGNRGAENQDNRSFALVVTANGDVVTWDEESTTPQPVPNLSGITSVSADLLGNAAALGSDGSMWVWRPGSSDPQRVNGVPPLTRLGTGTASLAIYAADCSTEAGSLWSVDPFSDDPLNARRVPLFGFGCQPETQFTLAINRTGQGSLVTNPPYVDCGDECSNRAPANSDIEVFITAAPGWRQKTLVAGSPEAECLRQPLRLDRDRTCAVTFEEAPLPKTLAVVLRGGGRVVSDPAGIDCPDTSCTETYSGARGPETTVTLSATADPGYRFSGFSGDPECAAGSFNMRVSRQCDATFTPFPTPAAPGGFTAAPGNDLVQLTWTLITDSSVVSYTLERAEGNGGSSVIIQLPGAADRYRDLSVVPGRQYTYRLSATNPSGTSPPATVTTTVATPLNVTLAVQVTGPGRVTSAPAGIDCPADCTQAYSSVANVTLSAAANANGRFDGWGGACAGTAPSTLVTMDDNKTCTALFTAVSEGGWQTLAQLATSMERHLRSSLVLNDAGLAYLAYSQTVGTQNRLTVRQEGAGFPILSTLNANATWSATGFELALDPAGVPLLIFNMDLQDVMVARWSGSQWDGLPPSTTPVPPQRLNLTPSGGSRVNIARRGNTLIAAWIENQRIALRRYDFVTNQWDAGALVPGPTNPFDIDLVLDSSGLPVIAWSDGLLGARLHAIRETAPGTWTQLGDDIGTRTATSPMVMELGIHVDTSNAIRLVWLEGDTHYYVSVAQFDGTAWGPLTGLANMEYFFHPYPVRSLSVNRNPALFAFAFEWDQNDSAINGLIATRQLVGGQLTMVGSLESTFHPRVGHLSLAMNEADRATIAQSEYTPEDTVAPFKLVIRRHVP